VSDFRERVTLGNSFFDEELYAGAGNELKKIAEVYASENGEAPGYFELLTLWFFLCARLARCDLMAVETGLGGRLDATNILDPEVSVITPIELEHTEYLGTTIDAIAAEKAGIIKPLKPLVLSGQKSEALTVFREHAERSKSPLFYFPDCAALEDIRIDETGTFFNLSLKINSSKESFSDLFVPMPGGIQAENAGLAVLAVKTVFPQTEEQAIKKGLAGFRLPARFERISERPVIVIDGAHTKQSVDLCLKTFKSLYGDGGILIFGCAADKDVLSMAELCVPRFSKIIITRPGSFKKSFPEEIYSVFVREAEKNKNPPELIYLPQTEEAIDKAIGLASGLGVPVLGTGSFYLAGEIRSRVISNVPL
jgi:dihydrofolate synthase/folylpolyglutamate synthase